MKIGIKDIEHMAELGCLALSKEEKQGFVEDLNVLFDHLDVLDELDTTDIKPTVHLSHVKNVMREDKVEQSMGRELLMQNAPEEEDGCFKVPRIVE
ncbi:MAG TPA: Asp-tRNA(Asn)/Glu-tRNA(Gln) amidotransferase subunit GatC [Clostridiales bacterium]|nr:Asp-tRNA(Asn)/Glu-tRNA(Gln) amidotransferase subunit GatC [Clostridiales bacterium]